MTAFPTTGLQYFSSAFSSCDEVLVCATQHVPLQGLKEHSGIFLHDHQMTSFMSQKILQLAQQMQILQCMPAQ
jgi:hypothetical protein